MYTYVYCFSIKNFLLHLMEIGEIADIVTSEYTQLLRFLSKPACRLLQPLKMDFNFIEVNDGYCFNIEEKKFEKHPPKLKGSPRAFVRYNYIPGEVPYPKPFVEGVENSFPDKKQRMHFYQKYYQILLHGKFPIKEPKLLLVGLADSGKTSWFYPFEGIIPSDKIASVVRDGRFSGHMINQQTQVVFMDEWTSDSLSCEDAKRILQGGRLSLPQKHMSASTCIYLSGFFITTNIYPDFGNERDCEAIRKRLAIFPTKPLKKKDGNVSAWLRRNCMKVFHYLAVQLKDTPMFECTSATPILENEEEENMGAVYNDFDNNPMDLLEMEGSFSFSYSQQSNRVPEERNLVADVPQSAVDSAVLQADKDEYILYEHLAFEHDLVDYTSEKDEKDYFRKVYEIVTGEWKQIKPHLTDRTIQIYEMKLRVDWSGADSVFDAWLLLGDYRRNWFNLDLFEELYPDWESLSNWVKESDSSSNQHAEFSSPMSTSSRIKKRRIISSSSGSSSSSSSSGSSGSSSDEEAVKSHQPSVTKRSLNPLKVLSNMASDAEDLFWKLTKDDDFLFLPTQTDEN